MSNQTDKAITGLEKAPTGIEGFDEITSGGLPRGRATLIIGFPGSGKTIFALQSLVNGARTWNEPGIFVSFEENATQIIANAESFGWGLPKLIQEKKIFFLDANISPGSVQNGTFDLQGMLAILGAKINEMGAKRIVFDSLDVLLTLLEKPFTERQQIYMFREWLLAENQTGIITNKCDLSMLATDYQFRYMNSMADCVIQLNKNMQDGVSIRDLTMLKYRGSRFSENASPLVFGPAGIEVAFQGTSEQKYEVFTERVSTGVQRLDTMLSGGYYRGSSTLITGVPGTAKSTLCGAFAEEACRRGERTLYVIMDEGAGEMVRNLSSVNIFLAPHLSSGLLNIYSATTKSKSSEEHFQAVKQRIYEFQPRNLVIDPLSGMLKNCGFQTSSALGITQRLLNLTKLQGITVVFSALSESDDPESEATKMQISTISDTWLHLSYVVQGGERNRALTIIKSRGTGHSNQVRELLLSKEGITLSDVYTSEGCVFMGTLRWEKEQLDLLEQKHIKQGAERKHRELELAEIHTRQQIETLSRELELQKADLVRLEAEQNEKEQSYELKISELELRRGIDTKKGQYHD